MIVSSCEQGFGGAASQRRDGHFCISNGAAGLYSALNQFIAMKQLAIAILVLFSTSLVGTAFANGCVATPRTSQMSIQEPAPACCDNRAACMGGSCVAAVHNAGCTSDHGVVATSPKNPSAVDLVKAPLPTIVPSLLLRTAAHDVLARPPAHLRDGPHVASYADVYARTGRLLI
jgi:hypothetical protein